MKTMKKTTRGRREFTINMVMDKYEAKVLFNQLVGMGYGVLSRYKNSDKMNKKIEELSEYINNLLEKEG